MLPTEASNDAIAQARAEERSRISAILAAPKAQGREKAALKLALSTDLAPNAIEGLLADFPLEATIPTREQRDHGKVEIGSALAEYHTPQEQVGAGWKSAFARVQSSR